ncbi:MAG: class I SAM-dependent methyltransferase [Ekhidna sp.]
MYEKVEECPICKKKQFDNYMICDDHSVTGESFAIVKCTSCGFVFTNPRPAAASLGKYYESNEYISHTDKANSPIHLIYKLVRNYTLNQKVSILDRILNRKGSVLDYGCGTGHFVQTARKKGWQAFGYEPDDQARKLADIKNPSCILDSIAKCPDEIDIITAWHVIEHVADINTTIKQLIKKLKTGGHIIMALPNHRSMDAQHYQEYWAAYDVPRHLSHFDQDSMRQLAKKFKLTLKETLPMKFDSFYVSMLSEKYKGGSILNALTTGLKSNNKAKSTGEYSSLIYIFQK